MGRSLFSACGQTIVILLASTLDPSRRVALPGLRCASLETYYQCFAHASSLTPWPSDILFILWVTPAVMMLLPRPEKESGAIDWQQVLDFAQIGVVALTAYLYFFYVPSRWEAEGPRMVLKITRLQMVRDVMLAGGFLIRAMTGLRQFHPSLLPQNGHTFPHCRRF